MNTLGQKFAVFLLDLLLIFKSNKLKKDRNWRKTRSKTLLPFCTGVDPNRNWDSHFGGIY